METQLEESPIRSLRDSVLVARTLCVLLESQCEALVKAGLMEPEAWGLLRDAYLPQLKRAARLRRG